MGATGAWAMTHSVDRTPEGLPCHKAGAAGEHFVTCRFVVLVTSLVLSSATPDQARAETVCAGLRALGFLPRSRRPLQNRSPSLRDPTSVSAAFRRCRCPPRSSDRCCSASTSRLASGRRYTHLVARV
jgi:hypothetical protein